MSPILSVFTIFSAGMLGCGPPPEGGTPYPGNRPLTID